MNPFLHRAPFVRFLLPLIAGIFLADRFSQIPVQIFYAVGVLLITLSFFLREEKQFRFRWFFGAGIFVVIFALSATILYLQKERTAFDFPETELMYAGIVRDKPQEKPRSLACEIELLSPVRKKIIVYLQPDSFSRALQPGSEILFSAVLRPFRNMGNPDDFDYVRYMLVKGFSATSYISSEKWVSTGKIRHSPVTFSRKVRLRILDWYGALQLDPDKKAFISALTLGYKSELSDNLKQAFRASGTSHVLAVSGLHVVFVFVVAQSLLRFLGRRRSLFVVRQLLVVCILWLYAFLTGGAPSVVRATIMFTVYGFGKIFYLQNFNYNVLFIAAFFILLFSPMSLFDVGFQLSFSAVSAILLVFPRMIALYSLHNRIGKYFWDLFSVSVAAQIGVFPLSLYYFGTFPSYFFIANLLVVPLVEVIFYLLVPFVGLAHIVPSGIAFFDVLIEWILDAFRFLIDALVGLVYFFESLPFSQLSGADVNHVQVLFLLLFLFFAVLFFLNKRPDALIAALSALLLFVSAEFFSTFKRRPDAVVIYNRPGSSEIMWHSGNIRVPVIMDESGIVPHPGKRILRLSENIYKDRQTNLKMEIDCLILSDDDTFSMGLLSRFFDMQTVVLEGSLSRRSAARLRRECNTLGIPIHDVSEEGAFYINF